MVGVATKPMFIYEELASLEEWILRHDSYLLTQHSNQSAEGVWGQNQTSVRLAKHTAKISSQNSGLYVEAADSGQHNQITCAANSRRRHTRRESQPQCTVVSAETSLNLVKHNTSLGHTHPAGADKQLLALASRCHLSSHVFVGFTNFSYPHSQLAGSQSCSLPPPGPTTIYPDMTNKRQAD